MAEEVKLFGVCGSPFSCRVEIGLKLEGGPILPQDPYERAMAHFWARFIDEKVKYEERENI
ncbi:hypothetical protein ACSBR2_034717 [Camellia fascicularis]